jgi:hypothetical protein
MMKIGNRKQATGNRQQATGNRQQLVVFTTTRGHKKTYQIL